MIFNSKHSISNHSKSGSRSFYSPSLTSLKKLLTLLLVPLFYILSPATASATALTSVEETRVIQIQADTLPAWLGQQISDYSVMAVKRNRFKPIPFQIDEVDLLGNVYFPEAEVPLDGELKQIDANDLLLFMLRDAGPKKQADTKLAGELVAEISIDLASGERQYVYLVKNARVRSEETYVRYASIYHQVETDYYSLIHNEGNALNWDDFQYNTFSGEQESPLDRMKLEMTGNFILPFPKIRLTNKSIVARPLAERVGAIRATTEFEVTLYLLGLPLYQFLMQVHYLPAEIVYLSNFKIPAIRRFLLYNPTVTIAIDGNNLQGTKLRVANLPDIVSHVDGVISNLEIEQIANGINRDNNWIWAQTGRDYDLFTTFDYTSDHDYPLAFHLKDEKTGKGKTERYEGKSPEAGYIIDGIPRTGEFGFNIYLYFSEGFGYESGGELYEDLKRPSPVTVTAID